MHEKHFPKVRAIFDEVERILSRIEMLQTMTLYIDTPVDKDIEHENGAAHLGEIINMNQGEVTEICRAALIADMERRITEARQQMAALGLKMTTKAGGAMKLPRKRGRKPKEQSS